MKRKMRTHKIKATSLLIITILLTTGIASIGIVYAETPTRVTGVFETTSVDFGLPIVRGGNMFMPYVSVYTFAGPLVGTVTVEGTLVIHGNGKVNFHGTSEFIGNVGSFSGVTQNVVEGTGSMVDGTFVGKAIVKSGSDGLENLHMVTDMEGLLGTDPGGGTYTAIYHVDPT
jgi:hypothetical protein